MLKESREHLWHIVNWKKKAIKEYEWRGGREREREREYIYL